MGIKFLKRSIFQRLLGISATTKPGIDGCWNFADGKLIIDLGKASELKTPGGAIRFEGKKLPKRVLGSDITTDSMATRYIRPSPTSPSPRETILKFQMPWLKRN